MRCFYHPDYFLPLPAGHPFPMEKFPEAHALVRDIVPVEAPIRLELADLCRAHDPVYLAAVSFDSADGRGGLAPYARNRLGLPAHPRLLARSTLETAGTVSAALAAIDDGAAANLAGGTHHAFPGRGLGYCVLNDVAVTVEYLRARGCEAEHIAIVDTDAHQGNARTTPISADDPKVVGRGYFSPTDPRRPKLPRAEGNPRPRPAAGALNSTGRLYLRAPRSIAAPPQVRKASEPRLIF